MKNKSVKIMTGMAVILSGSLLLAPNVRAISLKSLRTQDAEVKEQYNQAKQNYVQAKDVYKDARNDYLQVKGDLEKYRTGELKNLDLAKAQNYFLKVDQGIIKYLELAKKRIVGLAALSEEQQADLMAEINADIVWLEAKKSEIEAATDKTQLREIAGQVRRYWAEHRVRVKAVIGQALGYKIEAALTKLENVGQRVATAIENLKDKGQDVAELEELYTQFEGELDQAQADYQAAKEQFSQVGSIKDGDQLLRAGNKYLKEANQQLRLAHQTLKEIVKEMGS